MSTSPKHSAASLQHDTNSLLRQNHELRERLSEDAAHYRRRIDTYKQAQQNQAALVARLQSKVLQYKKKYSELEERIVEPTSLSDAAKPVKVNLIADFNVFFSIVIKNDDFYFLFVLLFLISHVQVVNIQAITHQ